MIIVEGVFLPLMQKIILGCNEGRKERRTELHQKVTQVRRSECIFSIRKRNAERVIHPPPPEAVLHSSGDGGSLPFPSPLGLPPLHRTIFRSLTRTLDSATHRPSSSQNRAGGMRGAI